MDIPAVDWQQSLFQPSSQDDFNYNMNYATHNPGVNPFQAAYSQPMNPPSQECVTLEPQQHYQQQYLPESTTYLPNPPYNAPPMSTALQGQMLLAHSAPSAPMPPQNTMLPRDNQTMPQQYQHTLNQQSSIPQIPQDVGQMTGFDANWPFSATAAASQDYSLPPRDTPVPNNQGNTSLPFYPDSIPLQAGLSTYQLPHHENGHFDELAQAFRDRALSSASYKSQHSIGVNTHGGALANNNFDPAYAPQRFTQDLNTWNIAPQQQAIPQASTLHRSASAGDMISQQHRQQAQDPTVPPYNHRPRGSVSGLPSHHASRTRFSIAPANDGNSEDPSLETEVLASPKMSHRPPLSLVTDTGTFNGKWSSPASSSTNPSMQRSASSNDRPGDPYSNYQSSMATLASHVKTTGIHPHHLSNASSQPALRYVSSADDIHGKKELSGFQGYSSLGSAANLRRKSLANADLLGNPRTQPYAAGDSTQYGHEERYDQYAAHSTTSSMPSTPDLSRQQSSSSFRSPVSEQSQSRGVISPPPHQHALPLPTQTKLVANDQPIPELPGMDIEEKTTVSKTWSRLASRPESEEEANDILRPHVVKYLKTVDRLELGERTVIVMTPLVVQKSYSTERRFIVPPPSAFVLGASWWTHLPDCYLAKELRPAHPHMRQLFPPSFTFALASDLEAALPTSEWTTYSGKEVDKSHEIALADDPPMAGRVVAQKLFIPASNTRGKGDEEAQITITSPGLGQEEDRTIGTFKSKPIKVISKPSKKAHTSKSGNRPVGVANPTFEPTADGVHNTETASTRFLRISGNDASFPKWDWTAMSGREEMAFEKPLESDFIGRTVAWDSFVVYGVDPSKLGVNEQAYEGGWAPSLGLPSPPAHAIPVPAAGLPLPIYYNQPIILQNVNTGTISPVVVIRQVGRDRMATGGVPNTSVEPALDLPTAPGEGVGEPVSQLHMIALEVIAKPKDAYANPVNAETGFVSGGTYLSCLGEQVGYRHAEGNRIKLPPSDRSSSVSSTMAEDAQSENPPGVSLRSSAASASSRVRSQSIALGETPPATNDGGKVRKVTRLRSATSLESPIARPLAVSSRKRGTSTASRVDDEGEELAVSGGDLWKQNPGEAAIWTIVGTDIARSTFYIPPMLFDGVIPFQCNAVGSPPAFLTPIPAKPLSNLPTTSKVEVAEIGDNPEMAGRLGPQSSECRTVTIYGQNLGPEWTVWFGDMPSPKRAESACDEVLICLEPNKENLTCVGDREILLIRTDGVIVPTRLFLRQ